MLHHPLGILAKPPSNVSNEDDLQHQSDLGSVPHQIRGFLNNFQTMILEGPAYPQCIACSSKIIEAYRTSGVEFLFNIFENPEYLTYLTGLDDLLNNDLVGLTEWASDENEDDF
jgi:ubiquitin-like modifier-activating enzyme ATG7